MTKGKQRLTAKAGAIAAIPINTQTGHFFKPTTQDRI